MVRDFLTLKAEKITQKELFDYITQLKIKT